MKIDSQIQHRETRRSIVKKLIGGAAALLLAGTIVAGGLPTDVSAGTANYKTTTALNLRSQANTSSAVILVIPQGGQVMQVGPDLNGFKKVSYSGKTGYASSKYLVAVNDSPGGGDMPAYIGMATTTASVNMRAGAGTNFGVLQVVPKGAQVEAYDKVTNSFRLVRYQGQYGYVHVNYLTLNGGSPAYPTVMTAIANLNVCDFPQLACRPGAVIPAGAKVTVHGGANFGSVYVTYNGVSGFVPAAGLK